MLDIVIWNEHAILSNRNSRNFGRGLGQVMLNMRIGRTFGFGAAREAYAASARDSGGARGPGGGGQGGGGGRGAPASPFSMGGGGPAGGGGSSNRRYSLNVSLQIRNITNHNNPGPIIANVTSPLFGQANQPAGAGSGVFQRARITGGWS